MGVGGTGTRKCCLDIIDLFSRKPWHLTFVTESTILFFSEISWMPLNIADFHLVSIINTV